ncbi:MAG: hypothetical protein IH840_15995, partial [Candidatus Heimdallarchaeota archaeon]|nr:hypothetical protein [Candidatus Heimdallarchaeota archaeon]
MSEEQSTNGLNNKLVFSRFVKLAEHREALYYDFIEIDEPDEIGNAWVEFSGKVVEDLLSVIKLNRNLFERFVDELRRTPDEPDPKGFDRIRNLTEFWLDLSVMSYLYATINKRGVLDQPGIQKNSKGYMDTKKSIDDLIILAFQTGQEFFSIDARLILSEVLNLDQEKKRLDFFDEMEDMEEEKFHLLGKYDQEQASFLMTRVKDRLIHSSTSWWWNDPIGLHSAAEHAISHINSMIANWNHSSSDLQEKGKKFYESTYPIARIFSDVALAQHYRRLALSALRARATAVASEYFAKAEALTSSLGIETLSLIDNLDFFKPSIQDQLLIYKHMQHLSTISQKYHSIIHHLLEGKIEEIKILVPEILDKLSKILVEGDIAYVSSVAVAYEGVFAYILEQLENNTKPEKIVNFVQKRINTLADRLQSASHQKTKNWLKLVRKNPEDVRSLRELTSNISLTLMSIYILPPDLEVVIPITSELLAVQNATEALVISAEANAEF